MSSLTNMPSIDPDRVSKCRRIAPNNQRRPVVAIGEDDVAGKQRWHPMIGRSHIEATEMDNMIDIQDIQ